MAHPPAFLETGPAGGHRMVIGGLTTLERRVRALAKAGAPRVICACEPLPLPALACEVEFVAPGTPPPAGAQVERADEIAGIVVVDERTRDDAEWAILRGLNKSFEGPVDAVFNSRFSRRITRRLARTRLVPNHVTLAAIVLGLTAAALVSTGRYALVAAAGVMLELNSILDSCDGELARLRFQYSKLGQWLDNVSDDIVDNVFLICCGVAAGGPWTWVAVGAAVARWFVSGTTYLIVYRHTGTGDVFSFRYWFETDKVTADEVYELRSIKAWIRSFGRRDTYVFGWMLVCLGGIPWGVAVWGAIIALINTPIFVAHLVMTARGAGRAARPARAPTAPPTPAQ